MKSIRLLIANKLPWLGPTWRRFVACCHTALPRKRSYSQHEEDVFFLEEYMSWKVDGIGYFDVGANHPTRISNTYLLYRNGACGVIIEPNRELSRLHSLYRTRDSVVAIGCGSKSGLVPFHISTTPVLSAFGDFHHAGSNILRTELVPVLTLDEVWTAVCSRPVFLLSIDTEGFEMEVLKGASKMLNSTSLVVLEANEESLIVDLSAVLGPSFKLIKKFGCNYVFRRFSNAA